MEWAWVVPGWCPDPPPTPRVFRSRPKVLVQDWRFEDDAVRPTASWLPDPDRLRQGLDRHPPSLS
jgi:hypothetical protein